MPLCFGFSRVYRAGGVICFFMVAYLNLFFEWMGNSKFYFFSSFLFLFLFWGDNHMVVLVHYFMGVTFKEAEWLRLLKANGWY